MQIEHYIKKLSRAQKEHLIQKPTLLTELYPAIALSSQEMQQLARD